jgi:hypothetical protein
LLNALLLASLFVALPAGGETVERPRQPHTYFRETVGLDQGEIDIIDSDRALAKVIDTRDRAEVVIFGAVFVNAPIQTYIDMYRDIESLAGTEAYLAVGEFSSPPELADVDGLTLDEQDIKDLKDCRPGKCALQFPLRSITDARAEIDWDALDVGDQVNRLLRRLAVRGVRMYQAGGLEAIGAWQDKKEPVSLAQSFESLMNSFPGFPEYAPEFRDYLLGYPNVKLDSGEDFFYWEKVKFGLKPTIRACHVTIHKLRAPEMSPYVIVNKQIYSSHYFLAAVDISALIRDSADPEPKGFYLVTRKASRQHGLTGFKGKLIRGTVVGRTRDSMERALESIKARLEGDASGS